MKKLISIFSLMMVAALPRAFASESVSVSGTVLEAINSGGYAYVLLDVESEPLWFAGPSSNLSVGDKVTVNERGIPMVDFHSKSLERDFDTIYFVNAFVTGDSSHTSDGSVSASAANSSGVEGITPYEGGKTIADVFAHKDELTDTPFTLRAKVVKFSPQIMGTNWLHLQDGTGDAATGSNDLTVTTMDRARIGDTVLVTGKLTLDKDFGYGYKYGVIIEDAKVTVE